MVGIAREILATIEGYPPTLEPDELESVASRYLALAEEPTMLSVAAAAGCVVTIVPHLGTPGMSCPGGYIFVQPHRSERVFNLRLAHEVAHHVLPRGHSHGDAWVLALLLTGEIGAAAAPAA